MEKNINIFDKNKELKERALKCVKNYTADIVTVANTLELKMDELEDLMNQDENFKSELESAIQKYEIIHLKNKLEIFINYSAHKPIQKLLAVKELKEIYLKLMPEPEVKPMIGKDATLTVEFIAPEPDAD